MLAYACVVVFTERSKASREAILASARRLFTERGYDRTTIRLIAVDAGVDPAMVIRYYRSKEWLFAAAAEADLRLPNLGSLDVERQADLLARHFLKLWDDEGGSLALLLRSAVANEAAAERLRAVFTEQVAPMVRATYGASVESDLRAGLISTQLIGFALTRYILRIPSITDLDHDNFIALTASALHRILVEPVPTHRDTKGRHGT